MVAKISENIFYYKASENPLSADVGVVYTDKSVWIFDVGASDEAAEYINSLTGEKNIVLSHFHADHMTNIKRVKFDGLYQGANTFKYTGCGEVVKGDVYIGSRLHIFELPSSHAKGSVGLEIDERYAFIGDAIYGMHKNGRYCYNVGQLGSELKVLKSLKAEYLLVSHAECFVQKKEDVIKRLEEIFSMRATGEAYIYIER